MSASQETQPTNMQRDVSLPSGNAASVVWFHRWHELLRGRERGVCGFTATGLSMMQMDPMSSGGHSGAKEATCPQPTWASSPGYCACRRPTDRRSSLTEGTWNLRWRLQGLSSVTFQSLFFFFGDSMFAVCSVQKLVPSRSFHDTIIMQAQAHSGEKLVNRHRSPIFAFCRRQ